MATVRPRKLHSSNKRFCGKDRTYDAQSVSFETSRLSSIGLNETNSNGISFENTPSPSSDESGSAIEHASKISHRKILSSTLKNFRSMLSKKRHSHHSKFYRCANLVNRQYMTAMTKVLFQMRRELNKIRRRTNNIEQIIVKQAKNIQPIIRIPRLTKDQLSTICVNNNIEAIAQAAIANPDNNNNNVEFISEPAKKLLKRLKEKHKHSKNSMNTSKKTPHLLWINHQQKPSDLNKYCSICRHEFSKRSNFVTHVRKIHRGVYPTSENEQDSSMLEVNVNDSRKSSKEHSNNNELVATGNQTDVLEPVVDRSNANENKLRRRQDPKSVTEPTSIAKVKCDICHRFYRAQYLKAHQRRAHPTHESTSPSNEINNASHSNTNTEKETDHLEESNSEQGSLNGLEIQNVNTPAAITIAEMDNDDVPIRFGNETNKPIVLAVTCLESYQLDLVEQFIEKFSSHVCQTASIDSRTTHLITNDDKNTGRSPLSMKLIEAIAHHCFCVSYRWIIDCLKYDRIIDEEPYEIEGDDTDIHPHGGPRRSRLAENRNTLFQNICFMIKCTENPEIKMTNERLEDLITTCGGQIITCVTQRLLDKYQIIVLCDMLYVSERRHNYDQCRSLGIHFVSSDWVLESILEYRQKPFSLFEEVPCN